jgi:uncharacterized protein with PIN domain
MAKVVIRCYEELNDFLPAAWRKRERELELGPPAPVRHLIETLGVPHTEVELVLVNGVSVDLDYRVADGDRISVYPMFEALDVTPLLRLRQRPLRRVRLVVDSHLGRLARYLRMLGFDTLFHNDLGDRELARLVDQEGRILLTRDKALLMRREVTRGCYVREGNPREQLASLVARLDLYREIRPFTRCMECNGALRPVAKEQVAVRLPERTRELFQAFWECTGCGRVYWKGSHFERMQALVDWVRAREASSGGGYDSPS